MRLGKFELRNPFAKAGEKKAPADKTAQEKIGDHVSTSRAFEDRQSGTINCWLRINSKTLPLEDTFVGKNLIHGRVTWAKILFDTFMGPYVDLVNDDFLAAKYMMLIRRFAWWDRHYRSMKRVDPGDF